VESYVGTGPSAPKAKKLSNRRAIETYESRFLGNF